MDSDEETAISNGTAQMYFKHQRQTPEQRRNIRDKYMGLIANAQRQNDSGEYNSENVIESMNEANILFEEVTRPREAIFDAKLINIHGDIIKKKAHSIQAGSPFSAASFLRKVAGASTGRHVDSSSDVNLDQEAWSKIGEKVFRMLYRTPKLNFIQGTFQEPAESVINRQRRVREKDPKTKAIEPKVVDASAQKANTDKTYEEIQRIKKVLSSEYQKRGEPMCYFSFTIDPKSFSRTIENIFHLSFLVKEREVLLSMDSNGLPVIEPVLSGGSTKNSITSQSILTMSVEKWKKIIDVFKITRATIPPPSSSRRHHTS